MGLNRARISEILADAFATLRHRPRVAFLGACLAVLALSWWGTQRFADRLLSSLPANSSPTAPAPLSEAEIQRQIDQAKRINDQLRANRETQAYEQQRAGMRIDDAPAMPDGAPPRPVGPARPLSGGAPDPDAFVATDEPAEPVYTVKAEYPELARQAGVQGTVVVQALVGTDGRVRDTRIVRSIPVFNGAAQDAVRQWRFKPAAAGGVPVATWVSVPMAFRK